MVHPSCTAIIRGVSLVHVDFWQFQQSECKLDVVSVDSMISYFRGIIQHQIDQFGVTIRTCNRMQGVFGGFPSSDVFGGKKNLNNTKKTKKKHKHIIEKGQMNHVVLLLSMLDSKMETYEELKERYERARDVRSQIAIVKDYIRLLKQRCSRMAKERDWANFMELVKYFSTRVHFANNQMAILEDPEVVRSLAESMREYCDATLELFPTNFPGRETFVTVCSIFASLEKLNSNTKRLFEMQPHTWTYEYMTRTRFAGVDPKFATSIYRMIANAEDMERQKKFFNTIRDHAVDIRREMDKNWDNIEKLEEIIKDIPAYLKFNTEEYSKTLACDIALYHINPRMLNETVAMFREGELDMQMLEQRLGLIIYDEVVFVTFKLDDVGRECAFFIHVAKLMKSKEDQEWFIAKIKDSGMPPDKQKKALEFLPFLDYNTS